MILKSSYAGVSPTGHLTYNITIRIPECPDGIATIRNVTSEDLMSGKELPVAFAAIGNPDFKFGDLGPSRKQVRAAVTKQERTVAESIGGRRQTGSGAVKHLKGDGRVEGKYRIENKMTTGLSLRVPLSDLTKIRSECVGAEQPIYEVEFKEKGTLRSADKWALVPWDELQRLINAASDNS